MSCVQNIAVAARRSDPLIIAHPVFSAPWGVQIAGSYNKNGALQVYLGAHSPMPLSWEASNQ